VVLTQVQLLGGNALLKFWIAKSVQKSVRFTTTFDFEPNIFGTDLDSDKI